MQILLVFIMASALVISFELTPVAFAQQTPSSVENAKKEGEVVWYGTLTGGSIVGRILKSFEARAFSRRGFLEISQRRQAALSENEPG